MAKDSNTKNSERYLDTINKKQIEIEVIGEEIYMKNRIVDQTKNNIVDRNILIGTTTKKLKYKCFA